MFQKPPELLNTATLSADEVQVRWEEAYSRFETPDEEIAKFRKRLQRLGQADWPRQSQVVEMFCGKGMGIRAFEELGFTNLEGVDISENLLSAYTGKAKLIVSDCRDLPFEDSSRDIMVVQGGLHHLPVLPQDLERTLREVRRVLRPDGIFVMVEPWLTPFLRVVHFLSAKELVRRFSDKIDACQTMIHYEQETYDNWLGRPAEILGLLEENFMPQTMIKGWGKLHFVGRPKPLTNS